MTTLSNTQRYRRFTASLNRQSVVDAGARLPQFTKPALIAWSADDTFFALDDAHRLGDALNHTTGEIRRIADVMVGQAENSLHHWLDLTLAAGGVLALLGVIAAALGSLRK